MNKKLKINLLSISTIMMGASFVVASSCGSKEQEQEKVLSDNEYVEKHSITRDTNIKETRYISQNVNKVFDNHIQLENFVKNNIKSVDLKFLKNSKKFDDINKNNPQFMSNEELSYFDFSKSTSNEKMPIFLGRNGKVFTSLEKARDSYFNINQVYKLGNIYANSKEELYNFILNKSVNNKDFLIEVLNEIKSKLNFNSPNATITEFFKSPSGQITSFKKEDLKDADKKSRIEDYIKNVAKKYVIYYDEENNPHLKAVEDYIFDRISNSEFIKSKITRINSNKGYNKYYVDNSKDDEFTLYGPRILETPFENIEEITDTTKWSSTNNHSKEEIFNWLKIQKMNSIVTSLFKIVYFNENIKKNVEITPFTPITINVEKDHLNNFKKCTKNFCFEGTNLYDYLYNKYDLLAKGKESNFLSSFYILYVAGLNKIIEYKANQKVVDEYKTYFKMIINDISKIFASLLPKYFIHEGISESENSDNQVNISKIWDITNGEFDLNSDSNILIAKLLKYKIACNFLDVIASGIFNAVYRFSSEDYDPESLIFPEYAIYDNYEHYFEIYSLKRFKKPVFSKNYDKFTKQSYDTNNSLQEWFLEKLMSTVKNNFDNVNELVKDILLNNEDLLNKDKSFWLLNYYNNEKLQNENLFTFICRKFITIHQKYEQMKKDLLPVEKKSFAKYLLYAFIEIDNIVKKGSWSSKVNLLVETTKYIHSIIDAKAAALEIALNVVGGPVSAFGGLLSNFYVKFYKALFGEFSQFNYKYVVNAGDKGNVDYIWNGGLRYVGLFHWINVESGIQHAKILPPVKIMDGYTESFYYFNGKKYNFVDIDLLKRDVVNYYLKGNNKIINNLLEKDEAEKNIKIIYSWDKQLEQKISFNDYNNPKFLRKYNSWAKNDGFNIIEANFGEHEDSWFSSLVNYKNGTPFSLAKETDDIKDILNSIKQAIDILNPIYYSKKPIETEDGYTDKLFPIDQFDPTKKAFEDKKILANIYNEDPLKNCFLYSEIGNFNIQSDLLKNNRNKFIPFLNSLNIRTKEVSNISFFNNSNYQDMELLQTKTLYYFDYKNNKYFFTNLDKARNYFINVIINPKMELYNLTKRTKIIFMNKEFCTLNEAVSWYKKNNKRGKNEN
ncbi:hypothetical protein [Mycoplasmopsis fermentans]|uniref:hypothetical protein n=1 Tax=Mycoplasmopsis fermentans TaxID=2115 RepID=UPI000F01AEBA|nr:hypothetical protein [Mycoplasmopsis fermentans]RMX36224.1 hypothetical protein MFI2_0054 [Mycoplasmopsis fermentans MF-I2]